MKKHGFTLVEILIVIVLFGMLMGIIFQTYTTISQVSFRLHQEKEVAKEALVLSQVLENLAQSTTIDYSKYPSQQLINQNGIVDTLHLLDNNGTTYQISSSGTCLDSKTLYETNREKKGEADSLESSPCVLEMITTSGSDTQTHLLLNATNFNLSKINFKIIPFIGNRELKSKLAEETLSENLPAGGQPAFWLLGNLYSKYYNPNKRSNNILLPLQLFFSLQGETENLYSTSNNENASAQA